ncbi:MAG: hypothetical protein LUE27_09500 [Clostridia bacterium]|nr:hypothetical protein [Clostridia bacterium]
MKIRLSNADAVQLAKAIKGGCLDTDRVDFLKRLVENYRPIEPINERMFDYYKQCLYRGVGFVPNGEARFEDMCYSIKQIDGEQYNRFENQINSGQLYRLFIKQIFMGMIALKAVGGEFNLTNPDFGFLDEPIPDDY